MQLTELQKIELLGLVNMAFCEIRSMASKKMSDNERKNIWKISDGLHNVPTLLASEEVDIQMLKHGFRSAGASYYEYACDVLDESILASNDTNY